MVERCTQNLRRESSISRGTSNATTTERCQYTTSVGINNTRYKRIQSLIQNHMRHVRSESARDHARTHHYSYIKAMNNMNNNNTEHARIFKDTPFFSVFVLLLLVWYIF